MKDKPKFDKISDCDKCGWRWRKCHVVPPQGLAKGSSICESCYNFNINNRDRWDDYLRFSAT